MSSSRNKPEESTYSVGYNVINGHLKLGNGASGNYGDLHQYLNNNYYNNMTDHYEKKRASYHSKSNSNAQNKNPSTLFEDHPQENKVKTKHGVKYALKVGGEERRSGKGKS
mmetsp:Transcript_18567/g.17643  ORF Transcript_18567/g.17643 Transcript_18567/m.17643 type:complete len:111 (+) Transcript_18567:413-745(+)